MLHSEKLEKERVHKKKKGRKKERHSYGKKNLHKK